MLALALSLALTAAGDAPSSVDLLESERSQLAAELHQAEDQRASVRPSWFFLGSGLLTMLSGFLALEVVGNVAEPVMPSAQFQIAPSTWTLGVIVLGGVGAIIGAMLAVWHRFHDRALNDRIDQLSARLEHLDAAIAAESPAQVAPDGDTFVPHADPHPF